VSSPRDKVLELVATGRVTAEEGRQLLAALSREPSLLSTWLFAPFSRLNVAVSLLIGALACAGSLPLSSFRVRFIGALDLLAGDTAVPWLAGLWAQLVVWPQTALVLWIVGLLFGYRPRFIELLGFVGAARLPYAVAGWLSVLMSNPTTGTSLLPFLVGPLILLCFVWFVLWLFQAFRAATSGEGKRLGVAFAVALVAAEALSKVTFALID
jgi:hypothetical protein